MPCEAFRPLQWKGSRSCSAGGIRAFIVRCTLAKARTAICRTRSREMPLGSEVLERDRIVSQPPGLEDASLAPVQHGQRVVQGSDPVAGLLAFGEPLLLIRRLSTS
jgi:hypothetical protein